MGPSLEQGSFLRSPIRPRPQNGAHNLLVIFDMSFFSEAPKCHLRILCRKSVPRHEGTVRVEIQTSELGLRVVWFEGLGTSKMDNTKTTELGLRV